MAEDIDIQYLFYGIEKKPHMWWDRFDILLTDAFEVLDNNSGYEVHTYEMKLCILNNKVREYFLTIINTNLDMQMNMLPMNITYSSALENYRNTANQRSPK